MRYLVLLIAGMILSGCADSSVNRTYRIDTAGTDNTVELNFYLDGLELVSSADTSATQKTDMAGAAGQGVAALKSNVEDIKPKLDQSQADSNNDNSSKPTSTTINNEEVQGDVVEGEATGGGETITFSMRPENGRVFTWFPLTGASYEKIIVKWVDKGEAKSFTANEPANDYNTTGSYTPNDVVYFSGKGAEACKNANCEASFFLESGVVVDEITATFYKVEK